MDNTPLSALEYVKNGQKILMEGLIFPFSTAKELNKHGILSEEELCAIRGLSGGADATNKLLDMIIAKGEQACYVLLQILHIPEGKVKVLLRVRSLPAPPHSPEEDFYQWVNRFTLKETQGPTETSLPRLIGNDLHLDVKEDEDEVVFEEAAAIMKQHPKKMRLYLHVDQDFQHLGEALRDMIFKYLPHISRIRLPSHINNFLLQLFLQAALDEVHTGQKTVMLLSKVIDFNTIFHEIAYHGKTSQRHTEFLLDLFSHIEVFETETGQFVQPLLNPVYQSAPAGWVIDLSERKASILLGVLELQTVNKPVKLVGWSDEETERKSFLQCLPYISQLGLAEWNFNSKEAIRFIANLFIQAAECDRETGEKKLQLLSSVCSYSSFPALNDRTLSLTEQSDFLLDLYSLLKDCENPSRQHVLQALQPVYQSAPTGWVIDLSKRKASILLGVLELQTVKKTVKLVGWSETEIKSFLLCLPYISQLGLSDWHFYSEKAIRFIANLFIQAAECDRETGEKKLQLLSSVCSYSSFPVLDDRTLSLTEQSDFLLDLYSCLKDCENPPHKHVLQALQAVYQSALAGWLLDLSERKASILIEVLELQTVKKTVKLVGWSDKENEIKIFIQCLPYISQLGFPDWSFHPNKTTRFIANLFIQAAECDRKTGGKKLQLLSSVCSYSSFPALDDRTISLKKHSDFLLDLYSFLKDCETPTCKHVLQALQPIYQSVPTGWVIDLSERKASTFLGVLELQTVKKTVKLVGWPDEETQIKSFLQCLPYISKLGLCDTSFCSKETIKFIANLFIQAAECDRETGEKKLQLLSSVCSYSSFPVLDDRTLSLTGKNDFLLDLYSCLEDYENPSRQHVLQALQPVYQAIPAGWVIDLSERKASTFLGVLELQTVKKTVKLVGWPDEETQIKSFLQCLPYISQLGLDKWNFNSKEAIRFIANLFIQAAECDRETGEKKLQLLSSVCSYSSFPALDDRTLSLKSQSDFLLNLYLCLKDCENPSREHVLQALQAVYQSAPAGWVIDLSERKASILLGVLELQTVKKPVKLVGWSDEETERKSFLQCLPYISQLGLDKWNFNSKKAIRFIANLFIQAAECDRETGEKKLQLLSSVCNYSSFPFAGDPNSGDNLNEQNDFLLDLYSFLKDCENPSCKHVLQALQPVYQSAPAGWVIDLSKRKASILLGVLELQTVKKPVKLVGWSDEENEQRSFLQCLPYVSELDVSKPLLQQLLSLISVGDEVQVARQAAPLSWVLGRKVDLSHIQIDPQTCMSLAAVLEQAEGLSELDLSHCQVNDHSVDLLLPHLHKARVLDLSNNEISDLGALRIHSVVSASSYIQTVRLFNNRITDTATFLTDPRYDLWDQSKDQITEEFKPDLNHHNGELSYSFSCESGGKFQCSETGLVFLLKAPGRVEYSPAYWDEAALKTAGYEPAGPLFNIENPDRGLCSLRLPHCEADVEGREHLSVAHFCGGNMEVLKPLAVTETHVTIHVQNLSLYGLLRNIFSISAASSIRGQVLLFQPPGSLSQKQVKHYLKQHLKCRYITTTADCTFIVNQKYSVTSDPKGVHKIQPESWDFFCNYGPNFHPTFEVPFNHDITEMRLAILDDRQHEVWVCRTSLTAEAAPDSNPAGDAEVSGAVGREVNPVEAGEQDGASGYMKNGKHFVDRHWGDLINRVGLVPPVLDYLLQSGFMELEMYSSIYNEKNPCDQMRSLMLKVIMPGGNRAKDELCRILETQQKCLMEELKGQ